MADQQHRTDKIGGQGGGAFSEDLHSAKVASWVVVVVIVVGVVTIGVGVTMFLVSTALAWVLIGVGAALALLGLVAAVKVDLMGDVS